MALDIGTISDVPEDVREALFKAQDWASEKRSKSSGANAAFNYLLMLDESIVMYGTRGCRIQLNYILSNLSTWKGDDAKASKNILKNFLRQL